MSLFITFEGPEGSGKSTQARLLYEQLQAHGYPVIVTREPGGTRIGELIRKIIVDLQHTEMNSTTEILLFSAARAQLVSELVRPYLATGGIVLCDRYADSTYAYQGYGLHRDLDELRTITQIATGGLQPDLTIYLDMPAAEGLERKRQARNHRRGVSPLSDAARLPNAESDKAVARPEWNRLDARDLAYHERVEEGFRALVAQEPHRWRRIDAREDINVVAHQIATLVEPFLARVQRLEQD